MRDPRPARTLMVSNIEALVLEPGAMAPTPGPGSGMTSALSGRRPMRARIWQGRGGGCVCCGGGHQSQGIGGTKQSEGVLSPKGSDGARTGAREGKGKGGRWG